MFWSYFLLIFPLMLATLVNGWLAVYALRRPNVSGARAFAFLVLTVAGWTLGYAFELVTPTLTGKLFWTSFNFLFISLLPFTLLNFILRYTNNESWLTRRNLTLSIIPALITLLLAWSNSWHRLIRSAESIDYSGIIPVFSPSYAIGFWLFYAYFFLVVAIAILVCMRTMISADTAHRRQLATLIISLFVPWLGNAVYLFRINPLHGIDLTPFSFTLSSLISAWGMFRLHLLDILPRAREVVVESMSDGIIVLDRQNRIIDLNPAAQQIIGLSHEKAMGKSALELFKTGASTAASGQAGNSQTVQFEMIFGAKEDQNEYEIRIAPFTDQHGQTTGRMIILRDITKRKRSEEILRRQNEYLNALHATAMDLIRHPDLRDLLETIIGRAAFLVDTSHGYIYLLEPDQKTMKLQVGIGLQAENIGDSIHPGEGLAGRVWQSGKPLVIDDYSQWEGRLASYDKSVVHNAIGVPLTSKSPQEGSTPVVGVIGLAYLDEQSKFGMGEIEVLNRFAALASVALENARLYGALQQELVERRETEIKLARALDAAEAANRAKSTFLANMGHELRTPLNAIIGYSEFLLEEAQELGYDSLAPDLKKIRSAGNNLLTIISDVLDLSMIEAGKMELELQTFDLAPMINYLATTIRPMIEKNANRLQVKCPNDIGAMHTDMNKLRQVLLNLLSNAAKFTRQGTVTLEVQAQGHPDERQIIFRVADTGIGISEQQLSKLFQEFTQIDASTTRKYGGTGLGLSISRHFCLMMGGDIEVASQVGFGSTFTVRLPATYPAPRVEPHQAQWVPNP